MTNIIKLKDEYGDSCLVNISTIAYIKDLRPTEDYRRLNEEYNKTCHDCDTKLWLFFKPFYEKLMEASDD